MSHRMNECCMARPFLSKRWVGTRLVSRGKLTTGFYCFCFISKTQNALKIKIFHTHFQILQLNEKIISVIDLLHLALLKALIAWYWIISCQHTFYMHICNYSNATQEIVYSKSPEVVSCHHLSYLREHVSIHNYLWWITLRLCWTLSSTPLDPKPTLNSTSGTYSK